MEQIASCTHVIEPSPPFRLRARAAGGAADLGDAQKRVALTFDDGPSGWGSTDRILALLDGFGIKATFFVVGGMIDSNPQLAQREANVGHLVENHSMTHPEFSTLGRDAMIAELDGTTQRIVDLGVDSPQFFRPPYGDRDGSTLTDLLDERGLTPMLWTIDSRDWEIPDADTVHQNVLRDLRAAWSAGEMTNVVLFHDIQPHTPDVIEALVPDLVDEGCVFVRVDAV